MACIDAKHLYTPFAHSHVGNYNLDAANVYIPVHFKKINFTTW